MRCERPEKGFCSKYEGIANTDICMVKRPSWLLTRESGEDDDRATTCYLGQDV